MALARSPGLSTLIDIASRMAGLAYQVPGNTLNRPRNTMFFQYQPSSRWNTFIRLNQLMRMPENTGIRIAHRNGLLRAQAEHSISQPTAGRAHSAYTGISATRLTATLSGLPGPQTKV